ncbi:MAG: ABC transporter ATP-binding protein [Acidimicrobiales bacterium]
MTDDIIVTEGLTKRFPPDITAVDGLDLSVHAGEIFGLLGPNGAGKSTTIGMLTTRVTPTSGRASVGGVDVIARPAVAKQVIGVVPQTNTLDRAMTVFENLEFHGRYFGMSKTEAKREAGAFLERVRLADRASAPVMALSGGMAQRLMVARAIMHRPQVLFLDEPTAGLDPQSRLALWDILREFHREGQTILITTHHMEEADQLCDRVAIMDHGRILALDTPAGLKRSLGSASVVRISASGPLEKLVERLHVTVPSARSTGIAEGQMRMTVDDPAGILPIVLAAADEVGVAVTDLSIEETTLETVFINLTGKDLRE